MHFKNRLCAIFIALLAGHFEGARAQEVQGEEPQSVQRLISALEDPSWEVRYDATRRLIAVGARAIAPLIACARASSDQNLVGCIHVTLTHLLGAEILSATSPYLVVLNKGGVGGVAPGMVYEITREGVVIGKVRVETVRDDYSIARARFSLEDSPIFVPGDRARPTRLAIERLTRR